jgi:translation initiation factor IF-2
MTLGMMVTMNQRLDSETLQVVVEEFGFEASFIGVEEDDSIVAVIDSPEDLKERSPIVTVMGHVDHGKTSLLDHIREANVIAGEAGGITQHIGAYEVTLKNGKHITFIDTPGHEAFTAMRARGAKVTDIAIIVIAADDDIMPQTKEAIAHAQAAGVPMVFAINKVDKDTANPDKIKEKLAGMNLLIEEWGGKFQSHDVSAKTGLGVEDLLEKVLLESELLELKANPDREASGSIIEATLDKGRGYITTLLVQNGTLNVGDYVLAGSHSGKVKAMHDERGNMMKTAGPSRPVSLLGLDGAPQAGDTFKVFEDEREAKNIAGKRKQLQREHSVRTQKQLTLDEIGRRLAIGDFQELNIILKGDMDGSIEALSDSLQKLSTEEIQVNIIHKAVGQISESDVLLATASGAIIVGFQVRPSAGARKLAELESVDIRTYSIIYAAIEEVRDAMEGMLSPDIKEEIICNIEIREVFKITKVGTIAGCMVIDGKVNRNTAIRVIRDGIVVHTGELGSLKRFKDDVKEVAKGYECGLNIAKFNDIKEGDIIEGYTQVEVAKKL